MQYVDQNGRNIRLGTKVGTGGEGAVYEIVGTADFVAKVYHQPATPEKATKLAAMAQFATPQILTFAAWPKGTLHRSRGSAAVGIILPRIKNSCEIHELYSPAHRKSRFPRADWRFLLRTARNCAAAFATLHDNNIVIGDVNQGNIFVSQRATVNLIDCDSFQVQTNGRVYHCPVGVAHFVPPELQNAQLAHVVRTANHDGFGLAVLIFHLLFMGRHPFAGRYSGKGDMPIEKAISEYRFAYGSAASRLQMAPPPNSLTLAALPRDVALLFERSFGHGSERSNTRPTANDWARALEQLEHHLRQCKDDPGHFYVTHLRECPWCHVIRSGGPNFFISVTIQTVVARSASFDFAGIWTRIQAIPRPDQSFTRAPRSRTDQIRPRPIPTTKDENRLTRNTVGIIAVIAAALSVLAIVFPPVALLTIPMCVVFAIWWFVAKIHSPIGKMKQERRRLYRSKINELARAQSNQRTVAQQFQGQFQSKLESLNQLKRTYEQLKTQRDNELQVLQQHVRQRQLDEHLRSFFISNAQINGIGPGRISSLESYGIETAYEVAERKILSVPGFGKKLTKRLLDWRRQKENEFRFNPSRGIPPADLQALEMKFAQQRSQCERVFQRGPHELRQISHAAKLEVEGLDAVIARLEFECAQAKLDLRVFDEIPWWY